MKLVVWYGFETRLCKSESNRTIYYFMQVPFKYKFRCSIQDMVESYFSLQKHPIPLQKSPRKPNYIFLHHLTHDWILTNCWFFCQTVDQTQLTILYSICFISPWVLHVQTSASCQRLFNTTSRVIPAKIYQKTYTMSRGPNMP